MQCYYVATTVTKVPCEWAYYYSMLPRKAIWLHENVLTQLLLALYSIECISVYLYNLINIIIISVSVQSL